MKNNINKLNPHEMKLRSIIYGIFLISVVSSCGVPQEDFEKLQIEKKELLKENERLLTELDECQNGAERIAAKVEKAYNTKDYSDARLNINKLYERHPESPKNDEFKELLEKIEKEELALQKKKEAEEKERIRLANINNTGMWTVRYYVDDFGEPTKKGYISNTNLISGTFSNTATQNSALSVRFLISNSSDISFKLFEYAGNNPVKTFSSTSYTVLIQDKDGERLRLNARNYSDRLSFDRTNSRNVHNALMKGGTLKFRVVQVNTPSTNYEFTIQNADWYENAYRKLRE